MRFDMVLVFPYKTGMEKSKRKTHFNKQTYINLMLGLRIAKKKEGYQEEFIDEAQRILRTNRCFLLPDGTPNTTMNKLEASMQQKENRNDVLELNHQIMEESKRCLREEYVAYTGSDEPTTQKKFMMLLMRTIVRRLHTACGLSTKMKFNKKGDIVFCRLVFWLTPDFLGDEIIVCISADSEDLRVEADRCDYRVQLHNFPFAMDSKDGKIHASHQSAPTFNRAFKKKFPDDYAKALQLIRDHCDESENPSIDPGLWTMNWQPKIMVGACMNSFLA